jgi:uncharacterized Zn finger protein (UPF0148 family)
MKKYLFILPLIVLPIVGYSYFNNQTKKQDNKNININNNHINSNSPKIEPVKYYSVVTEVELVYKHCDKCKIGVYLSSDDGSIKCTHCESKENN